MPVAIRNIFTDLFLFNISKAEYKTIYEETSIEKNDFIKVIRSYKKEKMQNEHSFIYMNRDNFKVFINWNELIFDEEFD